MSLLPIVERELRVLARRGSTYNGRWIAVLIAILFSLPYLLQRNPGSAATDGKSLFGLLTMLAFAYSLLGGARLTCDSLSSEKREGTLGLLFLTDLKGYDVILGKVVSSSLTSFYGLLALMPVFGLPLFMGGVTGGEFWRVTLALVNTLLFSLGVGLWISARSQDEHKVLAGANVLLITVAGGLPLIDWWLLWKVGPHFRLLSLLSPGYGCYLGLDAPYKALPRDYWISLGLVHMLAWMFIGLASRKVHRYRQDELNAKEMSATEEALRWEVSSPISPRQVAQRRVLLSLNPVFWLAQHQRGQKLLIWFVTGLRLVFLLPVVILPHLGGGLLGTFLYSPQLMMWLVNFVFWYVFASVAVRFFVQARRNGTIELLLCTPLGDGTILDGVLQHLKKLLTAPLFCILVVELGTIFFVEGLRDSTAGSLVQVVLPAVGLCVQAIALCYLGLWLGLTLKKPGQTAFRAFAFVVLIPYVCCSILLRFLLVPFFYPIGGASGVNLGIFITAIYTVVLILVQGGLIFWARNRLRRGIRAAALCNLTGETPPRLERPRPDPANDLGEYFSLLK